MDGSEVSMCGLRPRSFCAFAMSRGRSTPGERHARSRSGLYQARSQPVGAAAGLKFTTPVSGLTATIYVTSMRMQRRGQVIVMSARFAMTVRVPLCSSRISGLRCCSGQSGRSSQLRRRRRSHWWVGPWPPPGGALACSLLVPTRRHSFLPGAAGARWRPSSVASSTVMRRRLIARRLKIVLSPLPSRWQHNISHPEALWSSHRRSTSQDHPLKHLWPDGPGVHRFM